MAVRDDLIELVDDLRRDIVDAAFGMRLDSVVVRTTEWSGSEIGRGAKTDTDVTLGPVPKVERPSPRLKAAEPGKYEEGDVTVRAISATYTRAQLDGSTASRGAECIWLVNGDPYRVVSLDEEYLGWTAHLRRMRSRS